MTFPSLAILSAWEDLRPPEESVKSWETGGCDGHQFPGGKGTADLGQKRLSSTHNRCSEQAFHTSGPTASSQEVLCSLRVPEKPGPEEYLWFMWLTIVYYWLTVSSTHLNCLNWLQSKPLSGFTGTYFFKTYGMHTLYNERCFMLTINSRGYFYF